MIVKTPEFDHRNNGSEDESENDIQNSSYGDDDDGDTPISAYQALLGSLQAKGGTFTQAIARRCVCFSFSRP